MSLDLIWTKLFVVDKIPSRRQSVAAGWFGPVMDLMTPYLM